MKYNRYFIFSILFVALLIVFFTNTGFTQSLWQSVASLLGRSQMAQVSVPVSGLVAEYKFDNGTASDSSGNGATGTISGAVKSTESRVGSGALYFDGVDDFVSMGDISATENVGAITVSAWVKPAVADNTSGMVAISKADGTSPASGWLLWRAGSNESYRFTVGNGSVSARAESNSTYADTNWHHIVGVYNGSVVQVYVDGVAADSTPPALSGTIPNIPQHLCIGTSSGSSICKPGSSGYKGIIDDVRIYNRALLQSEITELYNSTAGIVVPPVTTTPPVPGTTPSPVPVPVPTPIPTLPPALPLPPISPTTGSWVPPIGIPDPGFGINESKPSRPSNWSAPIPGYYYVNNQTGTNVAYGTPGAPRSTIPNPIPAGSYVEVHGTYSQLTNGEYRIQGNGTAGPWVAGVSGPVWVVGENAINRPTFPNYSLRLYGTYLYVDTVYILRSRTGIYVGGGPNFPAHHIMVRNSEVQGDALNSGSGISVVGSASATEPASPIHHIIVYNNQVHSIGDINTTLDQDAMVATASRHTSYVWFVDNIMHDATAGFRAGGSSALDYNNGNYNAHHIYAGRNTIYRTHQSGLWVKYARDVVFSENNVYGQIINATGGTAIGIGAQYAPQRLWIIFNTIHDIPTYGVRIASNSVPASPTPNLPIYIIGNVIYNIGINLPSTYDGRATGESCIHGNGGTERYIIGNTCYNVSAGINASSNGIYRIENNIVSTINSTMGSHLNIPSTGTGAIARNNMFYQPGGSERIKWGTGGAQTIAQLLISSPTACQNCRAGDPLFVNPGAFNFNLQSTSPAINAGLVLPANILQEFQNAFGVSLSRDKSGSARPVGPAWDIGAYEFGGAGGGVPVVPPIPPVIPINFAPTVSAGPDRSITLPSTATLSGSASDDRVGGTTLITTWTRVSGPIISFSSTSSLTPTATFTGGAGTYVLRLTATDGILTSTDDMTVIVATAGVPPVVIPPVVLPPSSYEGFGAVTRGALSSPTGYTTYHVTSLGDNGAGTLRDAVSQGNRLIVFDVAGTIRLQSDLNVFASYLTIDGATAPSPGITIEQPGGINTTIYGRSSGRSIHDVIVRHLRTSGMSPGVVTGEGDVWGMDGQDGEVYNIIIDHVTGVAASDGVFDIYGRVHDVTISWNLIKDTVAALHLSREADVKENISIHHNVFAHNNERQIRLKDDSRVDYVNNVVYGWGWYEGGGAGLNIDTTYSVDPTINVINNNFHYVDNDFGSPNGAITYGGGVGGAKVYMSGNVVPVGETDGGGTVSTPMTVPVAARVTTYIASVLGNSVVPCAGTHYPTSAERTLLSQVSIAIGGSGGTACSNNP